MQPTSDARRVWPMEEWKWQAVYPVGTDTNPQASLMQSRHKPCSVTAGGEGCLPSSVLRSCEIDNFDHRLSRWLAVLRRSCEKTPEPWRPTVHPSVTRPDLDNSLGRQKEDLGSN